MFIAALAIFGLTAIALPTSVILLTKSAKRTTDLVPVKTKSEKTYRSAA